MIVHFWFTKIHRLCVLNSLKGTREYWEILWLIKFISFLQPLPIVNNFILRDTQFYFIYKFKYMFWNILFSLLLDSSGVITLNVCLNLISDLCLLIMISGFCAVLECLQSLWASRHSSTMLNLPFLLKRCSDACILSQPQMKAEVQALTGHWAQWQIWGTLVEILDIVDTTARC